MVKKSKFKYIISSIVIGITSLLIVLFSLLATGVIGQGGNANRNLVIMTNSNSKVYDGTPLSDENYILKSGSLLDNDTLVVEFESSITDVGTIDNVASAKVINKKDEDVSSKYNFTYEFGTLEVTPSYIEITSMDAKKIYDGTPLKNEDYLISSGKICKDHRIEMNFNSSIIDVGVKQNDFTPVIFDSQSKDVTSNYSISKVLGTLEVVKKQVTFTSLDLVKEYDGTPIVDSNYNLKGTLPNQVEVDYKQIEGMKDVCTSSNFFTIKLFKDGKDITYNFDVIKNYGTYQIKQRPITLKSRDALKNYDGNKIDQLEAFISSGTLVDKHVLKYNFTQDEINAGKYKNNFTAIVLDEKGKDITSNYILNYEYGNYVINPKVVEFTSSNQSKIYDGTSLVTSDITITSGELLEGHTYEIKNLASLLIPGSIDAKFDIYIYNQDNLDVTKNYKVIKNNGVLSVLPIELQFKTGSSKRYYDGTPLKNEEVSIINGEVLNGHTIEFSTVNEITNAGIVDNDVSFIVTDKDGNNVTACYKATNTFIGTLEVLPLKIDILTDSASKKYDGKPLINHNYTIISSIKLVPGHTLELIYDGSQLEVGVSKNSVLDYNVFDENGTDITFNYSIEISCGDLIVTEDDFYNNQTSNQIIFKILADESGHFYFKEKSYGTYDGYSWKKQDSNELFTNVNKINPQYFLAEQLREVGYSPIKAKITPMVSGFSYHFPYYQDNFDSTLQRYDYTVMCDYNDYYYVDFLNFNYKTDYGLLTTVPDSLKEIESVYYEYVKAHYLALPDSTRDFMLTYAADNNLMSDSPDIILEVADNVSHAAKYDLNFKPFPINVDPAIYFLSEAESGVCRHYACSAAALFRALGIPARYVTGFSLDAKANEEVEVDGMHRHAWVEVYLPGNGWVTVEVTGSSNGGSGDSDDSGGSGEMEKKLFITPYPTRKQYDGIKLNALNKIMGVELLTQNGYTYECEVIGERTDLGITKSKIKIFKIFNKAKKDVTKQFKIVKNPGIVQIYDRIVDVKTPSASKVYDGLPLLKNEYEMTGQVEGLKVQKAKFNEPQKLVGKTLNNVSLTLLDNNGVNVTDNVFIRYQFGTLEITPRPITITTASNSKKYDGEPFFDHKFTVENLASTDNIIVLLNAEIIGIGTCDNIVDTISIKSKNSDNLFENLTYCYDIEIITGKLEVYY